MTDKFIDELNAVTTPLDTDLIVIETDPSGTDETKKHTLANFKAFLKTYFDTLYTSITERVISGHQGFGDNYVITPSISSNNLTVALKGINGNDPSASNPIRIRVADTVYTVTVATSYTKNAGVNWHGAGSAELNANAIDFFFYAIAETGASAGIKFGHSRIPYAKTMADFVNTTTSEKYIAGNWTNFNSTDKVNVIGRFRAQLSASASFNWSIATAFVVNRPIFETENLTYTPVITYTGGTTNPTSNTPSIKSYQISGRDFRVHITSALVRGTGDRTIQTFTLPWGTFVATTSPANALEDITAAGLRSSTGYMSGATIVLYNVTMANNGTIYFTGVNTMN